MNLVHDKPFIFIGKLMKVFLHFRDWSTSVCYLLFAVKQFRDYSCLQLIKMYKKMTSCYQSNQLLFDTYYLKVLQIITWKTNKLLQTTYQIPYILKSWTLFETMLHFLFLFLEGCYFCDESRINRIVIASIQMQYKLLSILDYRWESK